MMNEMQLLSQFEDYIINDLRLKRINCCIKYDKQNEKLVLGIFDKKVYQETIHNIQQSLDLCSSSNHNDKQIKHKQDIKNQESYLNSEQEIDDLVDSLNNLNQICNKISCSNNSENKKYYTLTSIDLNDSAQNKTLTKAKEQQLNLFIKYQNISQENSDKQSYNPDFSVNNSKNFFNLNLEGLSLKNKFDANHQFFNFANSLVVVKYVDFELYQQLMKSEESLKVAQVYNHTSVKNTAIESTQTQTQRDLHLLDEIQHHRDQKNKDVNHHKTPLCMNANIYHSIYKPNNTEENAINDEIHKNESNEHSNAKVHKIKKTMAF